MTNIPKLITPWQDVFQKMSFIRPYLIQSLLHNSEKDEEESILEDSIFHSDDEFDFYDVSEVPTTNDEEIEDVVIKQEMPDVSDTIDDGLEDYSSMLSEECKQSKSSEIVVKNGFIIEHKPTRETRRKIERDYRTLINEVRIRPVLWDFSHPLHKNRVAMTKSWDEIGEKLDQKCEFIYVFLSYFSN